MRMASKTRHPVVAKEEVSEEPRPGQATHVNAGNVNQTAKTPTGAPQKTTAGEGRTVFADHVVRNLPAAEAHSPTCHRAGTPTGEERGRQVWLATKTYDLFVSAQN